MCHNILLEQIYGSLRLMMCLKCASFEQAEAQCQIYQGKRLFC